MTDKQIIIDVSKCEHYEDFNFNCLAYRDSCGYPLDCKDHPNCYFKQLKRREQELEQYKKSKQASYEQLQARCNELELGIRKLQKQFGIEILYCKATGESTFRSTEILKLKQTLTEIKEIAEEIDDECEYSCFASCAKKAKKQILKKISEVLDESN